MYAHYAIANIQKIVKCTFFIGKIWYFCHIKQTLKTDYEMKAFVNDIEVRTYYGAKVKSVVLAYCRANNLPLKLDGIEVRDAYGNRVDLDGALLANSKIYVKH